MIFPAELLASLVIIRTDKEGMPRCGTRSQLHLFWNTIPMAIDTAWLLGEATPINIASNN